MIARTSREATAGDVAGARAGELVKQGHWPRYRPNGKRARARWLASDPVLVQADFRCLYCGADLLVDVEAFLSLTRDHLIARCHGGRSVRENVICACRACDALKGNALACTIAEARELIERRRQQEEAVLKRLRELVGWEGQ